MCTCKINGNAWVHTQADARKAKLKAEAMRQTKATAMSVATALNRIAEALVENCVTTSKTVSEEEAMARILPVATKRLSELGVHAYTVLDLQTVVQRHLRHKLKMHSIVETYSNAFAAQKVPKAAAAEAIKVLAKEKLQDLPGWHIGCPDEKLQNLIVKLVGLFYN